MTLFVVLMATLTEILVWPNVLLEEVLKWSAKENVHVHAKSTHQQRRMVRDAYEVGSH